MPSAESLTFISAALRQGGGAKGGQGSATEWTDGETRYGTVVVEVPKHTAPAPARPDGGSKRSTAAGVRWTPTTDYPTGVCRTPATPRAL